MNDEQTIQVFCDCCSEHDSGTRAELERRGWELYSDCQFCGEHGGI